MTETRARAVLDFWFGSDPTRPLSNSKMWFEKSDVTDDRIRSLFVGDLEKNELEFAGSAEIWLAQILVFDQFSRNVFRGTARSFAFDDKALALSMRMTDSGLDRQLEPIQRSFVYLPFEHSERLEMQDRSVASFEALYEETRPEELRKYLSSTADYARRHREVIRRFGRFPHRNAILGRASTAEELEFLKTPGSSF